MPISTAYRVMIHSTSKGQSHNHKHHKHHKGTL